jgi:hypothetical protein
MSLALRLPGQEIMKQSGIPLPVEWLDGRAMLWCAAATGWRLTFVQEF